MEEIATSSPTIGKSTFISGIAVRVEAELPLGETAPLAVANETDWNEETSSSINWLSNPRPVFDSIAGALGATGAGAVLATERSLPDAGKAFRY